MSVQSAQAELFAAEAVPATEPDCQRWRVFKGKSGVEVKYRNLPSGALEIDFVAAGKMTATRQSRGRSGEPRIYLNHPELGRIQERGERTFLAVLAMALAHATEVRQARLIATAKEEEAAQAQAEAAQARERERAAVDRLMLATAPEIADDRPPKPRKRLAQFNVKSASNAAPDPGRAKPSRYFNPFVVDWRGTKQFFQIPDWVARSPLTPISQIVYSRLLFPLAGADGFCERFDKTLGVVFGLNCAALAKHLGKDKPDYIERVVKLLCNMENPCIELHGAQGQTKTVRYLRTRWMSREWLQLCKVTPYKKSEARKATSDNLAEAGAKLPTNCRKFPLSKRILLNESLQNESPAREAPAASAANPPRQAPKTRARSSGQDSTRRQIAESLGATAPPSKFARNEGSSADEVWRYLCIEVGRREIAANGAMWMKRLKTTRRALALAVSDWKAKTPAERQAGGGNAAAYITAVYEREKRQGG